MDPFSKFLKDISSQPLYVLDKNIPLFKYIPIDLSAENKELQSVNVSSSNSLGKFISKYIKLKKGIVGYGGYNETRSIYQRSKHFNKQDIDTERNIHLGIDLWLHEGTPIYTPLDAVIHSFKNNTNYGDYGPTIILQHNILNATFYTLYGHLSIESITNIEVGKRLKQGERIATLGDVTVNGDYPPHLHFQIIKDIENFIGDYPGVCSKKDLEFYLNNCPNPNFLLKLGV